MNQIEYLVPYRNRRAGIGIFIQTWQGWRLIGERASDAGDHFMIKIKPQDLQIRIFSDSPYP